MTSDFAKLNKYDLKMCDPPSSCLATASWNLCIGCASIFWRRTGGLCYNTTVFWTRSHPTSIRRQWHYCHGFGEVSAPRPWTWNTYIDMLSIGKTIWKQFGISSAEPTSLFMSNRPVDEPNRDGVYSHYNSWYMTMWRTPCAIVQVFNPLWSSDITWRHGPWSILFHATICQLDHLKPTSVHLDIRILSHGQHLAL